MNEPLLWFLLAAGGLMCSGLFLLVLAIALYALRQRGRKLRLNMPKAPTPFGTEDVEHEVAMVNWQRDQAIYEIDESVRKAIAQMEHAAVEGSD